MLNITSKKLTNAFDCFQNAKLYHAVVVVMSSLFIALAAQITLPLLPVPVSMQNFAVLLVGAILGPKVGCQVILLYLLEGICGLPVFAGFTSGLPVIFGPTGGYLAGYIGAVSLTGYLLQHGWVHNRTQIFIAALLGDILLFTAGYLALTFFVGYHKAYLLGVAPFYLAELGKLLLLTMTTAPFLTKAKRGI